MGGVGVVTNFLDLSAWLQRCLVDKTQPHSRRGTGAVVGEQLLDCRSGGTARRLAPGRSRALPGELGKNLEEGPGLRSEEPAAGRGWRLQGVYITRWF